jgi:hypothetical protein
MQRHGKLQGGLALAVVPAARRAEWATRGMPAAEKTRCATRDAAGTISRRGMAANSACAAHMQRHGKPPGGRARAVVPAACLAEWATRFPPAAVATRSAARSAAGTTSRRSTAASSACAAHMQRNGKLPGGQAQAVVPAARRNELSTRGPPASEKTRCALRSAAGTMSQRCTAAGSACATHIQRHSKPSGGPALAVVPAARRAEWATRFPPADEKTRRAARNAAGTMSRQGTTAGSASAEHMQRHGKLPGGPALAVC